MIQEIPNMSSSSSDITYRPTPLERAYASYLLETYFDIPFNNTTNNTNSGVDEEEIRLSGRTAVSFLIIYILGATQFSISF